MKQTRTEIRLAARFSAKQFIETDKTISDDQRDSILNAAVLAPSSHNLQPYKFIWLSEEHIKSADSFVFGKQQENAKGCVVVCSMSNDPLEDSVSMPWASTYHALKQFHTVPEKYIEDSAYLTDDAWAAKQSYIPMMPILTASAEMGISSCPMEGFKDAVLRSVIDGIDMTALEPEFVECNQYIIQYIVMFGYNQAGSQKLPQDKIRNNNIVKIL